MQLGIASRWRFQVGLDRLTTDSFLCHNIDSGEVYSWGDGMYGKTCQEEARTTYVPWISQALRPYAAVGIVAGKDHAALLVRKESRRMDRFRRFVVDGVEQYVLPEYLRESKSR